MRLFGWLALVVIAACNSKESAPTQLAPTKSASEDPWNVPTGPAADADVPTWANDPPTVLRDKINGVNAHVIVLKSQTRFLEYRDVLAVAEKTAGVVAAEPFIFAELEISKPGKTPMSVALKAVDPARAGRVLTVGRHMKTGTLESLAKGKPPSIILGDVLARTLDVRVGDVVTLTPPKIEDDPRSGAAGAKPAEFRVSGTFHMDFDEYDDRLAFASLSAVQAMLGRGDQVIGIEMTVKDLARADEIANGIEAALGGPPYDAMDWYELNQQLFTALGHPRP